jgi:hypothetical protein
MKKFILLFALIGIYCIQVKSQTYNMNNTPVTTCSGTFYDSQGTSDYLNSESFTKTFTPSTAGNMLRFTFNSFSTESCCDYLRIYNGPTTASPLIGQYQGTTSPGTITAANATGELTFQWYSDGSIINSGWDASISCVSSLMTYISSTVTQTVTSDVNPNSTNQQIIGIQIVTDGFTSPLSATSFAFSTAGTNGTTAPATDIQNARLWYTGTTGTFATTTQFGSVVASPNGAFTITGTQTLAQGTNYFWLTYDIPSGATLNNWVDARCSSLTVGVARTPSTTSPAGGRQIRNNYLMNNTPVTTCSGTFYDSQGTSDYLISESYTKTFTPATAGNMLRFVFNTFSTESCCDYLRIYNGPTTASPLIGQYQGTTSPGTVTAANATGELTFQWYSDGSVVSSGWDASISCVSSIMTYVSSTVTQVTTAEVNTNTTNQEIICIQIVTDGFNSPLSSTSFSLSTSGTNGTTAPGTDIQNARLWYTGNSNTFSTTTQFGATVASPNGAFVINGTQTLATGTNYFWLTYDIPSGATLNNWVDAQCSSLTVGSPRTPSTTSPAGGRQILNTYLMSNTSVTTCNGLFYDSGGSAGTYQNSETYTKTFTPSTAGSYLQFVFNSFITESVTFDYLSIYDGPTTGSPLIGTYGGSASPGTITATNATGQLTFYWRSDGSSVYAGWEAAISCISPILVSNTPYTVCSGLYTDDGGPAGNYTTSKNFTQTFTPTTPGMALRFVFTNWAMGDADDYLRIYNGPNTGSPLIGTFNSATGSPGSITAVNATGQLTFVWFSDNNGAGAGWTANISCVTPPPSNDDCWGATPLTVNPDYLCGTVTAGTVANATASSQATAPCFGTPDDDVWFSFVATSTTHRVSLLNVAGSTTDMYHAVYSGSCGTLTNILCSDADVSNPTGLTPGNTYYVRVYTYTSTPGQTSTFNICIGSPPPPPPNDNCAGAINVPVNPDLTCALFVTSYTQSATNSGIAACAGSGADDDVWFRFVATSTSHTFDILNVTGTTTDMVHEIFSGTCASPFSIACSDPNSSEWGGFTVGQTYFVRVYTYSNGSTFYATSFDLCIGTPPPPPSNDEPCGAIPLNVNPGFCSFQTGVLETSVTVSAGIPAPGCGSLGPDIWFTAVVPPSGQLIVDMASASGPLNFDMAWYTAPSCSGPFTLIECDDYDSQNGSMPMICRTGVICTVPGDCQQNATLTPGTIIYIRIWEYFGDEFGPFDICAYEPAAPGGVSNCASAQTILSIPFGASGQTTCCRANSVSSSQGCASSYQDGEDFLYQYTPSVNETVDITLSGTSSYTGLFVTRGCPTNGSSVCIASNTSATGNPRLCGLNLTAGETYFIMIDTDPTPNCTPFNITITSAFAPTCNLDYTVSSIGFSPDLNAGTNIALPIDDRFSSSYIPIGFEFCFDGIQYTQLLVSSNGYVIFSPIGCSTNLPSTNAAPNEYSQWPISAAVPNTTDAPRNCIMFPWHDINPAVGGTIRYQVLGTAPNRRFVLTYTSIPYYSCTSQLFTGQLKLFETTNNVEIHIAAKSVCSGWNSGVAILGLHNYNGTLARVPAGYNYPTQWTATNQAWRFACNCAFCIVLPVELFDFSGEYIKPGVNELSWKTGSEINNDRFEIERLNNQGDFEYIGKVPGHGNSNLVLSYSFLDQNAPDGIAYYRLKQIDNNGDFHYSPTISINPELETLLSVQVSPNPADEIIHVAIDSPVDNAVIMLVSATGIEYVLKSDVSVKTKDAFSFDITTYPAGMYLLIIRTADNEILFSDKLFIR